MTYTHHTPTPLLGRFPEVVVLEVSEDPRAEGERDVSKERERAERIPGSPRAAGVENSQRVIPTPTDTASR